MINHYDSVLFNGYLCTGYEAEFASDLKSAVRMIRKSLGDRYMYLLTPHIGTDMTVEVRTHVHYRCEPVGDIRNFFQPMLVQVIHGICKHSTKGTYTCLNVLTHTYARIGNYPLPIDLIALRHVSDDVKDLDRESSVEDKPWNQ